jgi:vacuolar-type H+-ATPase subunit I/STV1
MVFAEDGMLIVTVTSLGNSATMVEDIETLLTSTTLNNYGLVSDSILRNFYKTQIDDDATLISTADNQKVTLLIIIASPELTTNGGNIVETSTITQGEEFSNVGLSFTSSSSDSVDIDTVISLDGVRVNKLDTNKTGTYSIRTIATDANGRTTRVVRTVVVEPKAENKEIKVEEPVKVETTKTVEQVKEVETKTQETSTRKVIENTQMAMRIEKKERINTYRRKKQNKNSKKESFTFKLFSKWFFKVYDG